MRSENDDLRFNLDTPAWYFVGEFSIDRLNFDELLAPDLGEGSLSKALNDCGIPGERIERITGTIAEAIKGVKDPLKDHLSDVPVEIRLFSNRKISECLHFPGGQMNGAWGYYLIEKGDSPSRGSRRIVELYLYREGGGQ